MRELADRQGLVVRVASVGGDDLVGRIGPLRAAGERFVNLDTGDELPPVADVVTANAYVGAAPIAAALAAGADVVVTGRVTDASLVVGPGIWAFGWGPDDLDEFAGAVVAGHVIECGAQCCGGNYAFFDDVPGLDRVGFPLVELAADGSAVVTKHPGTGGAVTVGTVTAQLLYEIAGPRYLSPDAVARFDTVQVATDPTGTDRVRISGVRGEPPPPDLKVTANLAGGWRNAVTLVLTGTRNQGQGRRRRVDRLGRGPRRAATRSTRPRSSCPATSTVPASPISGWPSAATTRRSSAGRSPPPRSRPPSPAIPARSTPARRRRPRRSPGTGRRPSRPARSGRSSISTGSRLRSTSRGWSGAPLRPKQARPPPAVPRRPLTREVADEADEPDAVDVPLGVLVGARSGDKGGNANVGLWAESDDVFAWLLDAVDVDRFRALLPEIGDCPVDRYVLANLRAVNFVVHGILGWGVASNLRLDGQAKALGELVRARSVAVPRHLLAGDRVVARLTRLAGPVPALRIKCSSFPKGRNFPFSSAYWGPG